METDSDVAYGVLHVLAGLLEVARGLLLLALALRLLVFCGPSAPFLGASNGLVLSVVELVVVAQQGLDLI